MALRLPRLPRRGAAESIPFERNSDGFNFDTQIIIQLIDAGKRIVEMPIPTYYGDEICYVNGMRYARDVVPRRRALPARTRWASARGELGSVERRVRAQGGRGQLAQP